jgi:anti-sigma factor RsiW
MKHSEAQAKMMDALDGALSAAGRAELDRHLADCAQCRAEWDGQQQVDRLLAHAEEAPAPAGFARRVVARLDEPMLAGQGQPVRSREDWVRALAGVAVLALGGLALAAWTFLPVVRELTGAVQTALVPAQWPVLLAEAQGLIAVVTSLGQAVLALLNALNALLGANPVLLVAATGLLGLVAMWAWMLQQVTSGRNMSGRTIVLV